MEALITPQLIKEFKNHVVYAATLEMSSVRGVIVPIEHDSAGAVHNLVPLMDVCKVNYIGRFKRMGSSEE